MPAVDVTLITAPERRSTIPGRKRRSRSTGVSHSSRTWSSSSCRSDSWNAPPVAKPALLTSTSTRSARPRASWARCSGSVRSCGATSARTPCCCSSSPASSRRRSSRRATSVTLWPSPASRRANSVPIPDDAPVTTAVAAGSGGGNAMLLRLSLEVAQRALHHRVGDRAAHGAGHEAPGVDRQVELDAGAIVVRRQEAPLAGEVAEVAAEVLARQPPRLVVDLAQPVADDLDLRVDLVLDDRAAAVLVALEHADRLHRALPRRDLLVVGHQRVAALGRRVDVDRAAVAVGAHQSSSGLRSSRCTAGPCSTSPSGAKRDPWHGQSQLRSARFQLTWQPRCVQVAETATSVPSSRRWPATFSPPSSTMSPSPAWSSSMVRVGRCA